MTLPQRVSFSAQLSNCNVATCWQVELSKLSLLHPSFSIHSSNGFNCSIKFFLSKIAIGLASGESWPLLAQPHKNTDVIWCLQSPVSVGRLSRQTCKTHLRRIHESSLDYRLHKIKIYINYFASALGGACAMGTNTMALIQKCQIQAIMTVLQRLSFSAQLTNCNVGPCWHVLAHIGACWHSTFSTFHSLGNMFSCSIKFFLLD